MLLAIDTNIIAALLNAEPTAELVSFALAKHLQEGSLIICGQVYAELLVRYPKKDLDHFLQEAGIETSFTMSEPAWTAVSNTWRNYLLKRKRQQSVYICPQCQQKNQFYCSNCGNPLGGPKFLLADFVVGAHALHHADSLLTFEQQGGFYKTYLPELTVVFP